MQNSIFVRDSNNLDLILDLALCYYSEYKFDYAIGCYDCAIGIYKNTIGEKSLEVAQLHEKIGDCYFLKHDYDSAIGRYEMAATIYDNVNEKCLNSLKLAKVLEKTGRCYYAKQDLDSVMVYYEAALNHYDGNSIESAALLKEIGDYYLFYKDDFNSADIRYSKALRIYVCDAESIHNTDIASIYYSLGRHFYSKHAVDSALDFFLKAIDLCRTDPYQHNFIEHLNLYIGLCYIQTGDNISGYNFFKETLDLDYKTIISLFSFLDTKDRTLFWNNRSVLYQDIYPAAVLKVYEHKTINLNIEDVLGDLYNKSALFAKGLLLTSEREIKRIIQNSKNSNLIDKYNEYINNGSTDTELEVLASSKDYGDFMQNLQLTWQDVQAKLGDNDIAIEFLSFPKFGTDSIIYIALTVRPGYEQPHLIELCEENELNADKAYTTRELSKLIWGKLATELDGVKNIYFSPSGQLHTVAIESMPHWEKSDKMMGDLYNIYRLSSTRELAMKRNAVESSGTVLYGGIEYVCDISNNASTRQDNHESKTVSEKPAESRPRSADFGLRDDTSLEYLWGSFYEVGDIKNVLGEDAVDITKCAATETSFKELKGKRKKYIHIATHGFYWNDSTAREKNVRFARLDNENLNEEDKAMTRTGLFFSGAQRIFDPNAEFTDSIDDGVLTAKEVADIDLRGLDLVVLSACQTGLGDIVGSEGVFGLQRGFKKAGAQSIIMSLWPVHDEATKDMMVEFYKALKSGKSKRQAFTEAQNFVKAKDRKGTYGYSDEGFSPTRPHWAAFILLDAVEKD